MVPDIAESHWLAVILEFDRLLDGMLAILCDVLVDGGTVQDGLGLHQHIIPVDGHHAGRLKVAVVGKAWSTPDDVVGLPVSFWAAGVDKRGVLAIHRGGIPICIGRILVIVENLDFVPVRQKESAVARHLVTSRDALGRLPLDVVVAVTEVLFADDGTVADDDVVVFDVPGTGIVPIVKGYLSVVSVSNEDGGIFGWVRKSGFTRINNGRVGPTRVMDLPG
ncbi:hypothetical protein [Haladaptatus sp. DYF46]|uniref:hypothetical protein n=1 Tax=Haladaptatus sp. DYF46 TaxID=2886041 RepID=UPI001E3BB230|nr:hypothetical protein [Haladaptatus sp. DYF46]